MSNCNPKNNPAQYKSRADLLEAAKISHLPKLPTRPKFELPEFELSSDTATAAVCVGCGGRLDGDDTLQLKFSGCRKCVSIYGRLDAAREENAKLETREMLERMAAGGAI
jgi:hypothetical protein